jgi:hypothetical protein
MALTVSTVGNANSTTSSATLSISLTASAAVNDTIIVSISARPAGTSGAISISSVEDSQSNVYSLVRAIRSQGIGNTGASVAQYFAVVTKAMTTSDTITVNFSPNTPEKAAIVHKVVAGTNNVLTYVSNSGAGSAGLVTSISQTRTGYLNGDLAIGALAIRNSGAVTGDSDTTSGSWATILTEVADTGTSSTSAQIAAQTKLVTANSSQTWNVTFGSTFAAYFLARYTERPIVFGTAVATLGGLTAAGTKESSIAAEGAAPLGALQAQAEATVVDDTIIAAADLGGLTAAATADVTVSATGTGQGSTAGTATGLHVAPRTATGSGVGTQTASAVTVRASTASGTGVGSQTAVGLHVAPRTATGSGAGTSSSSGSEIRARTATGTGVGSATVVRLVVSPRTATGSGTGTQSATKLRTTFAAATGSGVGAQSVIGARLKQADATGSGAGTATVLSVKLFIFRTPTDDYPWVEFQDFSAAKRLFGKVTPGTKGKNIYKLTDGTYTDVDQRDVGAFTKVYLGGHNNFVTQEEKDDLVAAGYGAYVT